MTATLLDTHAQQPGPDTLVLRRHLPASAERVWAYLTDSSLRQQWLAAGDLPPLAGAPFELVWRNDDLSSASSERPPGFAAESRATCLLTELVPLRKLCFTWPGAGEVSFALAPDGDGVLLTVTHRRLADRSMALLVGAGWHMHLDILVARISGHTPGSFWAGWTRLRAEYDARLPA